MDIAEIKQRKTKFEENPNVHDWIEGETYVQDVDFLLQQLEKLQQENERYKEALSKIVKYDDGLTRVYEECAELAGIYEDIAKEALHEK